MTGVNLTLDNFLSVAPMTGGVRLDDALLGLALQLMSVAGIQIFNAEVDQRGMPRARRRPLGDVYKLWVEVGEIDAEGIPCSEAGYYIGWWRGLHKLCGEAGWQAKEYLKRPSGEEFLTPGMSFKVGCPYVEKRLTATASIAVEPASDANDRSGSRAPGCWVVWTA